MALFDVRTNAPKPVFSTSIPEEKADSATKVLKPERLVMPDPAPHVGQAGHAGPTKISRIASETVLKLQLTLLALIGGFGANTFGTDATLEVCANSGGKKIDTKV